MKGFVLLLTLTLVGCQNHNTQSFFKENRCYTYNYELKQVTRVADEWYSNVGVKVLFKVEICSSTSEFSLIRIYSPEAYEYKSNSPRPEFIRSPKMTNSFEAKLCKHAAFNLEKGRVKKILAPANYSVDGLNIYKGLINILQLIIKDTMRVYTLQEDGIEGLCNTMYTILDSTNANQMFVMKTKNLNDCLKRPEKVVGAAYTTPCTECKENSQAAITSRYYIKRTEEGSVIDQVDVVETHQYMPFNVRNGGSIVMEASQNIKLMKVENHRPEQLPDNFQDCGSLAFQFSDESEQLFTPVKQLVHQVVDNMQYLAENTWQNISRDHTMKFQWLTQIMHKADYELYGLVFEKCSHQSACRRIFWDVIASANSPNGIRLLKDKYKQGEITKLEAAQIVIISFHYSSPSPQVIKEAESLLKMVHKEPHDYLFRIVFLAYASLCHRHCIAYNKCPESALKLVKKFKDEVLGEPNEDNIILFLRMLENLKGPSFDKDIAAFLPGSATSDYSLRVQHVAMLCLKSFAKENPMWVRSKSKEIFINEKLHYSTRIFAVMSLLSAKPNFSDLMFLVDVPATKSSAQVEHFVISSLTTLATSTAPDLQALASACRMALNTMRLKSEWPKYATGKFILLSFYKDSLMAGVTTEVFTLNNAGSIFPNFISTRFETNILRNKFSPLEVGVGITHLTLLLKNIRHEADSDNDSSVDARKLLKMRSDQKRMPSEVIGGYVQMFGENIITESIDLKTAQKTLQELYKPQHSDSWITNSIYRLQEGVPIRWVKALTSVDASYSVGVCTGLPLKRSLTHVAITSCTGNAKAWFTPELPKNHSLSRINLNDIRLKTELSVGMDKHMIFKMGIQNSLLQAELEEYVRLTVNLPIKGVDLAVNIKNKSFKLEIPPCKEETNLFSLSARTFAVFGHGEETSDTESTPILSPEKVPNIINWNFKSDSESDNKLKERQYLKTSSARMAEQCVHHSALLLGDRDANTFGFQTRVKYSAVHAGLRNAILNRFVGDYNITCDVYPVQSESPIKSIQVKVQLSDSQTEKLKNRIQNLHSSESISRNTEKDEESEETPLEAQSGQHYKNPSMSPKKPQSSSSSNSDSDSSSSSSSSGSGSSSSSSSTRSSESSNRNSTENNQYQRRQTNRERGRRSLHDETGHSKPGKMSKQHRPQDNKNERGDGEGSSSKSSSSSGENIKSSSKSSSSSSESIKSSSISSSEGSRSKRESSRSSSENSRSSSGSSCSSSESGCRSSGESSSSSDSSLSEEIKFLGDKVPPSLTFVAQAIRSNNKKQGYQAKVYLMDKPNKSQMQLVMGELNDNKPRVCLYIDIWSYKAQASLSMENQCRYKNLEIEVSKGHFAKDPAIQVKIRSKKLPKTLQETAYMAEELLPSLVSQYDFNSICQNNTSEELVVGVAASSPQSVSVICKLPEKTFYKEDFNFPWTSIVSTPYPSTELTGFNFFTELYSRILREDEAVCQVEETSIRTFGNTRFNGTFNEDCRTLIAQECTEKPRFSIVTRKPKLDLPREIYIHLTSGNITIIPDSSSSLLVSYNGEPIDKDMYEDNKANLTIYRNESMVLIRASEHGLENVTYDCETLWVTVSPWMRGKTCGLCGSNDGEKRTEGHMPNHELAHNDKALFNSWLLEDSDCVTEVGHVDQTAEQYSIME